MVRNPLQTRTAVSTFSSRVYGWMAIGLGVTASIAYFLYSTGAYIALLPFWWVWTFGTLGIALGINYALQRLSIQAVAGLFLAYAALEGILFGTILPVFAASYGGHVIWSAFAVGASIFALAMGYGVFTKSDLTSLGKILTLGVIGLIGVTLIYMIFSFFFALPWMNLLISYLGLVIFVGLTAYDAQTIRHFSMQAEADTVTGYKLSLVMALKMYLNVIMIFWYLLQIFSSQKK